MSHSIRLLEAEYGIFRHARSAHRLSSRPIKRATKHSIRTGTYYILKTAQVDRQDNFQGNRKYYHDSQQTLTSKQKGHNFAADYRVGQSPRPFYPRRAAIQLRHSPH
ncbi:hypothetical protein [Pseudomonas sp. MBLB4136]|uniref:hypothetical protein n=1 Tax=Pseudomonas sp. MBLB4136 TaxID=3451558 RepID=UPI003F74E777